MALKLTCKKDNENLPRLNAKKNIKVVILALCCNNNWLRKVPLSKKSIFLHFSNDLTFTLLTNSPFHPNTQNIFVIVTKSDKNWGNGVMKWVSLVHYSSLWHDTTRSLRLLVWLLSNLARASSGNGEDIKQRPMSLLQKNRLLLRDESFLEGSKLTVDPFVQRSIFSILYNRK